MKIALFGASGFLGHSVANALATAGHEVARVTRTEVTDLADGSALEALRLSADVAINCAARVPTASSPLSEHAAMFAANTTAAANVAQWAAGRGIRRIVHCSTLVVGTRPWPVPLTEDAHCYPVGPVTAYASSKLAGEMMVGAIGAGAGMSCLVLRLSALYGTGMTWTGVLPSFIDVAIAGERVRAGSGAHADFLHVADAARAVVRAAEIEASGICNVAAGVETSIADLARTVLTACNRPEDEIDVTPSPATRAVVDVRRMRSLLGVSADVSLARGVAELVAARRRSL